MRALLVIYCVILLHIASNHGVVAVIDSRMHQQVMSSFSASPISSSSPPVETASFAIEQPIPPSPVNFVYRQNNEDIFNISGIQSSYPLFRLGSSIPVFFVSDFFTSTMQDPQGILNLTFVNIQLEDNMHGCVHICTSSFLPQTNFSLQLDLFFFRNQIVYWSICGELEGCIPASKSISYFDPDLKLSYPIYPNNVLISNPSIGFFMTVPVNLTFGFPTTISPLRTFPSYQLLPIIIGIPAPSISLVVTDGWKNRVYSDSGRQVCLGPRSSSEFVTLGSNCSIIENGKVTFDSLIFLGRAPMTTELYVFADPTLPYMFSGILLELRTGFPTQVNFLGLQIAEKRDCSAYVDFPTYFSPCNFQFFDSRDTNITIQTLDAGGNLSPLNFCKKNEVYSYCMIMTLTIAYRTNNPQSNVDVKAYSFEELSDVFHFQGSSARVNLPVFGQLFPNEVVFYFLSFLGACRSSEPYCPFINQPFSVLFKTIAPGEIRCYGNLLTMSSMSCPWPGNPDNLVCSVLPYTGSFNITSYSSLVINSTSLQEVQSQLASKTRLQPALILTFEKGWPYRGSIEDNPQYGYPPFPKYWGVFETMFFAQLNVRIIQLFSLGTLPFSYIRGSLTAEQPFCSSTTEKFRIGTMVSFLYNTYNASTGTTPWRVCYSFTDEIIPSSAGASSSVICCDSLASCSPIAGSPESLQLQLLILLLMLTCIGFGAYFSILLTRSLILSGSALVSHDSISYMSWSDVEDRKWSALTFYLLGSVILLGADIGFGLAFETKNTNIPLTTIITLVLVFWYFASLARWFSVFIKGQKPSRCLSSTFYTSMFLLTLFSMGYLFLCISWLALALLVAPQVVLIPALCIAAVIYSISKGISRMGKVMDSLEIRLRKSLIPIPVSEMANEERLILLSPGDFNEHAALLLKRRGLDSHQVDTIWESIRKFRRSRSTNIVANVIVTTVLLAMLLIFILLALNSLSPTSSGLSTAASGFLVFLSTTGVQWLGSMNSSNKEAHEENDSSIDSSGVLGSSTGRTNRFPPEMQLQTFGKISYSDMDTQSGLDDPLLRKSKIG